ncbi:class IIb bacteriocin, lactobin A/cerein 7B family [Empedobacter falsenii]
MKNIESFNLKELSFEEQVNTDGGFVPIVVFGIVAGAAVAAFGAGVGIGAVAYLAGR